MATPFRTIVDVEPYPFTMGYGTPFMLLGSCFAQNMGEAMLERKLPALVNPFGVVYNPVAMHRVLQRIRNGNLYQHNELVHHNELWISLDHHSTFSHIDPEHTLATINQKLTEAHVHWKNTQCLLLTFGTAWVYYYNKTDEPVANCHKIPAVQFTRRLLSVDEIVNLWQQEVDEILKTSPNLKLILTVSPVRHWKDGAQGNQLSKATLILAINQLTQLFPDHLFYFPSYEIVMDDLRDYRFYDSDMLHISKEASGYIWKKLTHSLMDSATHKVMLEVERIVQAVNHRPFNRATKEFKLFVENTLKRIGDIQKLEPTLNFSEEIELLNRYICT